MARRWGLFVATVAQRQSYPRLASATTPPVSGAPLLDLAGGAWSTLAPLGLRWVASDGHLQRGFVGDESVRHRVGGGSRPVGKRL